MPQKSEFVCHNSRFIHRIVYESTLLSRDIASHATPSFYGIYQRHILLANAGIGVVKDFFTCC